MHTVSTIEIQMTNSQLKYTKIKKAVNSGPFPALHHAPLCSHVRYTPKIIIIIELVVKPLQVLPVLKEVY